MTQFQTIVIGLGAMGSATCYQLAKNGHDVLGLDRYAPPHGFGSTHGETRITRLAIGEGEEYTPLALRSQQIWRGIEAETGGTLLTQCGALIISGEEAAPIHVPDFFENTIAAAQKFGVDHAILDTAEIRSRYPQFAVRNGEGAYYEPEGGFLHVEECVRANLRLAERHGAELHTSERALRIRPGSGHVEVETDKGSYGAENLVIAAGPWLPSLIESRYAGQLRVTRQVQYWFSIKPGGEALFEPGRCPVYIWQLPGKKCGLYGFPAVGGPSKGVKLATEYNEIADPEHVSSVTAAEIEAMYRDYVEPYFPDLALPSIRQVTCLYTVTPAARFIIDRHPDDGRLWIVSACSGHGFKHSAAIGEAVAEQIVHNDSGLDLSDFSFKA